MNEQREGWNGSDGGEGGNGGGGDGDRNGMMYDGDWW